VAAFHLALGQDGTLFVSGPTLSSYDCVYQIDPLGAVGVRPERFGRPQGIALDPGGALFVVEALAGVSGLYRLRTGGEPELVVAGPGLVGVAFDSRGSLVVCSKDTAYRLSPTPSGTA
jgi:sugar lactone lactonase YvrE